ncbi:hypothetical protein AK812_SmicGene45452, partial [Symbiodinium microadriaticum]
ADTGAAPPRGSGKVVNSCSVKGLADAQKESVGCLFGVRTAYLLSLFTGFLGVDRIYLGE